MAIKLQKLEEWSTFTDSQGKMIDRKTEIRFDPLTGESSRLVFNSGLKPSSLDYSQLAEKTGGANCPFCPENLLKMTPIFSKEISENGRIMKGEATCFPNLFPYSKHNGVVIFSGQHYVRLEEFSVVVIKDAFLAAQEYIQGVFANDKAARFASINWNYLPHSGGSILHPHIQVIVSESPTNYQNLMIHFGNAYQGDKEFFQDLYENEKSLRERWIGEKGNVAWVHAYAPKGHNDFLTIFRDKYFIDDIDEQNWKDFANGLTAIFATLTEQGFSSFNLSLNFSQDLESNLAVHARLIPRFSFGLLDTSDINFFQSLHQEPLTYKVPEEVAARARHHFQNISHDL